MAWNIGLLCVKVSAGATDQIIPDVFYETESGLYFEDASSVMMDTALAVAHTGEWLLIIDVQGRFIRDDAYPRELARNYKVKTFWISEEMIYRDYSNQAEHTEIKKEYKGAKEGEEYLEKHKIKPADKWGETIIFQIIEKEIFGNDEVKHSLMELRYAKYELD